MKKFLTKTLTLTLTLTITITLTLTLTLTGTAAKAAEWTSYPTVSTVNRVAVMHDKAFVVCGNTLCVADTANLQDYNSLSRLNGLTGSSVFDIRYARTSDRLAIVYTDGNIDILTNEDKIIPIPDFANNAGSQSHYPTDIALRDDSLYVQTSTTTVTVDVRQGLICKASETLPDLSAVDDTESYSADLASELNGALDENHNWVTNGACMKLMNGRLVVAQSAHLFYGVDGGNGHVSILDLASNHWSQITMQEVEKRAKIYSPGNFVFRGVLAIGDDESDPSRFYLGGSGRGIFEFTDDTLSWLYSSSNCAEGITPITGTYNRVSAVHGDADGNLWVVCSGINETQLRCRTTSGNWVTMPISGFTNTGAGYIDLIPTKHSAYDYLWLVRSYRWDEFGGAVYDRNGTDTLVSDDRSAYFTSLKDQDANSINPQYLYSVIEDNDGAVWLLTSIGPCIVDDQYSFFKNAQSSHVGVVRRVKIPRNDGTNLADYLLNNVETVCGLVDAANTKWIGTSNDGVYHLSADGLTQLDHFTTDNSPIFADAIQALEYDQSTGRLYISTAGGICVYQTDAIEGAADNDHLYCYPNPVRKDYSGQLYICNLKDQSDIRITDSMGHVVYQTKAYGGQTSWDLLNNSGDRVKPGVYYIYSFDENGNEGGKTKLLVL